MKLGARYYDPDIARFITQDSYLGVPGAPPSLHRYLYAYGNPTVYIDSDGHIVEEALQAQMAVQASFNASTVGATHSNFSSNPNAIIARGLSEKVEVGRENLARMGSDEGSYWELVDPRPILSAISSEVNKRIGYAKENLINWGYIAAEDPSGKNDVLVYPISEPLPTLRGYGSDFDEKESEIPVFPANVPENVSPEGYGTENVIIGSIPPSSGGLTDDETKRLLHDPILAGKEKFNRAVKSLPSGQGQSSEALPNEH